MAKIPTYKRRQGPPGFGETAPAPYDPRLTADTRAMGQAGGVLARLGDDFLETITRQKDLSDITQARLKMGEGFDILDREIAQSEDFGTMAEQWDKRVEALKKEVMKGDYSRTAQASIAASFAQNEEAYGIRLRDHIERRADEQAEADFQNQLRTILENASDPFASGVAIAHINDYEKKAPRIMPKDRAQKIKKQIPGLLRYYEALELAAQGDPRAMDVIKKAPLLPDERALRTREIQGILASKQREDAAAVRAAEEVGYLDTLLNIWDGSITSTTTIEDLAESGVITAKDAEHFYSMLTRTKDITTAEIMVAYDTAAEAIDQFRDGKIDSKTAMQKLLAQAPRLNEAVGRGLVDDLRAAMKVDLGDDGGFLEDPVNKRLFRMLDDYKTHMTFVSVEPEEATRENRVENFQKWLTKSNDLQQWLEKNSDATPEQKENFVKDVLLTEEVENKEKNILEKLLDAVWHSATWQKRVFDKTVAKVGKATKKEELEHPGIGGKVPIWETDKVVWKEGPLASPFPDYPDAYQEDGVWYVMRNGKRYRVEE